MNKPKLTLDARGKMCPTPLVMLSRAMKELSTGEVVSIQVDDRAFGDDVRAWCTHAGHELVALDHRDNVCTATVRKARG